MKKLVSLALLVWLVQPTLAQDYPKFGEFSQKEFDLEAYPDDPEAGAVVLFDKGEARYVNLNGELRIKFIRHKRIKILNESELDQADIVIKYYVDGYGRTESVENIKATCSYLEEGQLKTVSLEKQSIFDERLNQYWKVKRFSIPGVKVGSIIEIEYQLYTPFMFNLPDWEFQSEIPTLKSYYQVRMVPFYEYVLTLQSSKPLSYHDSKVGTTDHYFAGVTYQHMIHSYEMKNIPAFYDDEYITSRGDYINKIDFQLAKIYYPTGNKKEIMTTWEEMADELLAEMKFGKYIRSVEKSTAKEIIGQLAIDGMTPMKKIETIQQYVANSFELNNFYGKYATQKPAVLEKTKIGSIADINLYLVGMLRAAGFEVEPLILSTRTHGRINREYPFSDKFNYVIACVLMEETILLVDATQNELPFYLLPLRCLNDHGLVVTKDPYWLNLNSNFHSSVTKINSLAIDGDSLKVAVKEQSNYYDAYLRRRQYRKNEDSFIEKMLADHETLTGDFNVVNLENKDKDLTLDFVKKLPIEEFESKIYISPFGNLDELTNPLKRKKRDYPVDFVYKKERKFVTTVYIPENMEVLNIPENIAFDNERLALNYEVKQLDNAIVFQANYMLKKSIYQPDEYDVLKRNMDFVYKAMNSQLVLKRK